MFWITSSYDRKSGHIVKDVAGKVLKVISELRDKLVTSFYFTGKDKTFMV